jgi:hypothetical protein
VHSTSAFVVDMCALSAHIAVQRLPTTGKWPTCTASCVAGRCLGARGHGVTQPLEEAALLARRRLPCWRSCSSGPEGVLKGKCRFLRRQRRSYYEANQAQLLGLLLVLGRISCD